MSVSIKPLEDRIVVRPLEAEQVTASGLVIPDTAKEKPFPVTNGAVQVDGMALEYNIDPASTVEEFVLPA